MVISTSGDHASSGSSTSTTVAPSPVRAQGVLDRAAHILGYPSEEVRALDTVEALASGLQVAPVAPACSRCAVGGS
jgi:hypothetical protein